jgi:GAF domain
MSLAAELERLADALDETTDAPPQLSFTAVAERIAKNLDVKADEVAILGVSQKWRHLYFIVPEALKNIGQVPLTSKSALAARTARESRPEIINDFAGIAHATVFESIKGASESAAAIQKIISAPILSGDKVVAVIQISRKGTSPASAGPDFTPSDLGKVLALCKPLAKLLQRTMTD